MRIQAMFREFTNKYVDLQSSGSVQLAVCVP